MKRKMPERTVLNMIRVILVLPFLLLLALNMTLDAILTGIVSLFSKVISYCIKSCILVIAGPILNDQIIGGLKD